VHLDPSYILAGDRSSIEPGSWIPLCLSHSLDDVRRAIVGARVAPRAMARQLWVLRHAEAEPHGTRLDSQRRLTPRGEQQSRAAGIALARLQASFEAVLYSPKERARQTAELAAAEWDEDQRSVLEEHAPLESGFDGRDALQALSGLSPDGRLLVVGHEPDLSQTIADLTGGRVDLKKGGLAVVRLEGVGGELAVLLRPRELALIAGVPAGGN
jgi:phosphohistidine phosphatase